MDFPEFPNVSSVLYLFDCLVNYIIYDAHFIEIQKARVILKIKITAYFLGYPLTTENTFSPQYKFPYEDLSV